MNSGFSEVEEVREISAFRDVTESNEVIQFKVSEVIVSYEEVDVSKVSEVNEISELH